MKNFSSIVLIALLVLQLGCTPQNEPKQIKVSNDYEIAEDLSKMVKDAETIVIGTFQNYTHSYNAERNPSNENEESKDAYSETRVYAFKIQETLKGKTDDSSIQVSIPYTKEYTGLMDEKGNELRFRIPNPAHVQPQLGKKYVLFLRENEKTGTYQAPFTPYMIAINEDNKVVLQKPQKEVVTSLKASNNHQYKISVEGVHLEKDPISGKHLSELKKELEKELDS